MKIRRSALGFTLMELILVIVLLSIVSLYAAPRFFGKSSFSVYALQDQVISVVRQVQLNRMQSNIDGVDDNFLLHVSGSCIGSVAACSLTDSERESRSDVVVDDTARFSLSSGVTTPIDFSLLGNPQDESGDPLATVDGGVSIFIQGTSGNNRCEVTINSQGYVSRGDCS